MVTARLNTADFVTGRLRADWKEIPPAEWGDIILAATKDMNVAYLSTLQSLNQVVTRLRRYATGQVWRWPLVPAGDQINLTTADLLVVAEIRELPRWESWPVGNIRREDVLLAKREKNKGIQTLVFFTLEAKWLHLLETTTATSMRLTRVKDVRDYFCKLGSDASWVGVSVLRSLHSAQSSTRIAAEERAKYAREVEERLRHYLDRANIL